MRAKIVLAVLVLLLPLRTLFAGDELYENVRWTIFHEGCEVFLPGTSEPDTFKPIADLRACYARKQEHNPSAAALIRASSDEALLQATLRAVNDIPVAFDFEQNLRWVMEHEGEGGEFRRLAASGDAPSPRERYRARQNHNPNARNLLAAVSDRQLFAFVQRIDGTIPGSQADSHSGSPAATARVGQAIPVAPLPANPQQRSSAVPAALYENVRWTIFHEGCEVFQPTARDITFKSVGALRECYVGMQAHNPAAAAMMMLGRSVLRIERYRTTIQTRETCLPPSPTRRSLNLWGASTGRFHPIPS
jgi:hypothetical protein